MAATTARSESSKASRWTFDDAKDRDALFERAAAAAMLAPSAYNTQPWLLRVARGTLELHADVSRRRPIADPRDRELFLASGAALENIRVTVRYLGYEADVAILPDPARPHFVARVGLGGPRPASDGDAQLFNAIARRRSSRARFYERPVPPGVVLAIAQAAEMTGASLRYVDGTTAREALAHVIDDADRAQARDSRFRDELASWLRVNQTSRTDGMPGFAFGLSTPMAALAPLMLRRVAARTMRVVRDADLAREAPLLGVLAATRDEPREWIAAGQAMERVLLVATSQGVSTGVMNQAIQVEEARQRVRRLLTIEEWPVAILRFGFGPETPPTPRRPLADVLIRAASG